MITRQAVILVGGRGSRLGAATANTPKPLLAVGGVPFVEYLLRHLERHGFAETVLLCGHRAEAFQDYAAGRPGGAMTLRLEREPEPLLGTAGALRHARGQLADTFLLLNGDTIFDINLLDLALFAEQTGAPAAMALRAPTEERRYGTVTLAGERIGAFHAPGAGIAGPTNAGVYVLRREVVDRIAAVPCSLEADIFPPLAQEGALAGRVYDRPFIDIGVPADLARAQQLVPEMQRRPAAFLDRDGVLNEDLGYVHRREEFHWKDGARDAVKLLNDAGLFVFVVTNQAGVARGLYDETAVTSLHDWINGELREAGAHVDAFDYCPYHPEGVVPRYRGVSDRRKPAPGMIHDILRTWPVIAERSFMIGDRDSDLAAAAAAGIAGHRFGGGNLRAFVAGLLPSRGA